MFDHVIIKNILSLFSIKVASYIIPLVTLPYLVRVLEPQGYGLLGFSAAIMQYFAIATSYGFDLSATNKIAKENSKKKISYIFWNVISSRLIISLIGLIVIFILSKSIDRINEISTILLLCYLNVFGLVFFPQWLFQGKESLGLVSTVRTFSQALTIPFTFMFVKQLDDVWIAALLSSLPSIVTAIISMYVVWKRKWIIIVPITFSGIKKEMVDGWYIFISTAAISLYTTSVTVVIGFLSGNLHVANYVAANKLIQAIKGIYSPISMSFYPRISAMVINDKKKAVDLTRKLLKIQILLTLTIGLFVFLFSDYIVSLVFGKSYVYTSMLLKILSIVPVITSISNVLGIQLLIPFGYKKEFSYILIFSGGVSIFSLIPLTYFYGSIGSAVSVGITELIVVVLMLKILNKKKIRII